MKFATHLLSISPFTNTLTTNLATTLTATLVTFLASTMVSSTALAKNLKAKSDNPLIQINSFHSVGTNTELAELCGKVTGPKSFYNLRVISDDGTNNPGDYHTNSGKTGNFCILISTYAGHAQVEIEE